MKFRTRPCEIEAIQYDGTKEGVFAILAFAKFPEFVTRDDGGIDIPTLEGVMRASVGDWIVKGLEGEFYPMKPSIFEKKYERIE